MASYLATPGAEIRTEQHNPVFEDVASALSNVLVRDGRAPMTGTLNMNGQAITNVAVGNTPGSVATLAQAMPIGAVIDFAGAALPAGWALCHGQEVSRVTYADLYTLIGNTYGAGNGTTTFNLPDARGRVVAGKDNGGAARLTAVGSGVDSQTLGAAGGAQNQTVAQQYLPANPFPLAGTPATIVSTGNATSDRAGLTVSPGPNIANGNGLFVAQPQTISVTVSAEYTPAGSILLNGGSQVPLRTTQPTLILNKIIRVSYDA